VGYQSGQQMRSDARVTNDVDDTNDDDASVATASDGNSFADCAAALTASEFIVVSKKANTTKRPQTVPKMSGRGTASNGVCQQAPYRH